MESSPSGSTTPPSVKDKQAPNQVEQIHTNERIPGHSNYYEKNGLRTEGDGLDHYAKPKMSTRRLMSLIAMAFLWTGSQIPLYLFGGVPPYVSTSQIRTGLP